MLVCALAAAPLAPACVTQNVQFEVPGNFPPSIETPESISPASPLNRIIRLDTLSASTDGGVGSGAVVLDVLVRDPNLDQRLDVRVFVNFSPTDRRPPVVDRRIAARGELERRESVVLDRSLFSRRCNRVEMLVSSAFRSAAEPREPVEQGDLATATWFVVEDDMVRFSECTF